MIWDTLGRVYELLLKSPIESRFGCLVRLLYKAGKMFPEMSSFVCNDALRLSQHFSVMSGCF